MRRSIPLRCVPTPGPTGDWREPQPRKHGEPDCLCLVNLRRGEPVTLLLKTGYALAAGEAERIKETEKIETLVPWFYDGVIWQYADGREVRYLGYEGVKRLRFY